MFSSWFGKSRSVAAIPKGQRVYAVGDIHGRLDLLRELMALMEADDRARAPATTDLILLGDLIDRGPDSAGVVRFAMHPPAFGRLTCLMGNHEAAMLGAIDGDREMLRIWLRNGGTEALRSWGLPREALRDMTGEEVVAAAHRALPPEQIAWLRACRPAVDVGGYHFVHAGVRPGVPLDRQTEADRLWIRDEFLCSRSLHGAVVVHGHSISADVEERPNRIGIDTGAYRTGRLTALGLEGEERWRLQTGPSPA